MYTYLALANGCMCAVVKKSTVKLKLIFQHFVTFCENKEETKKKYVSIYVHIHN